MSRPRLLDLFCGAGGAAMGYHRAGFEVIGVDINPQPFYPFKFIQCDALKALDHWWLGWFSAIHASPPCQAFTSMSRKHIGAGGLRDARLDLLTPTLERLRKLDIPWVVENVMGAKNHMDTTIVLHGGMFGLDVHRDRRFESNVALRTPKKAPRVVNPIGVLGKLDGRRLWTRVDGSEQRAARTLEEAHAAMEMDWADWHGTKEAIPPAYTEYIGRQIMKVVRRELAPTAPE